MRSPPHMSIPTQTRVWHPAVTSSNSQNSEVSCVPMCSRGVLRGGKSDGATADGDDELHPRLPHLALGGHGDALLETSLLDCCPCHSSHSCWIQVSWELVRCPTRLIIYISPPRQQRNIAQECACWEPTWKLICSPGWFLSLPVGCWWRVERRRPWNNWNGLPNATKLTFRFVYPVQYWKRTGQQSLFFFSVLKIGRVS